ncbi:DUF924 family protein [Pigmentiphaga sp.]|uniref:DUF924 family protein n=1 Tax=Pigmentiphaga sp. TaxID=1977564 RepID=UPI00128C50A7|nr:DUF924 family protein [Pigmentiphaga sp.]MPS25556.1 DUF924 domain-containing protein [Alcaligenaceae bacterium SAGV5]MPS54193.1 DUF924 domain-containing protein [Alcaligenaceae bacterium SAGV3]MPT56170.1 DUF924 domain-containing protein [Alcaligenaceae bacterium]
MTRPPWQDVLDFWFLPPDDPGYLKPRHVWFQKNPDFDAEIERRFLPRIEQAMAAGLREWKRELGGALARIVLLDQFPRNVWRGTPRAFAGDPQALADALELIDSGRYLQLPPVKREFVYLPLMHSENPGIQERCVALYTTLAQEHPASQNSLDFAIRHRDIVERFGRFPHRNAALGRASTGQELEFLKQPGSGF